MPQTKDYVKYGSRVGKPMYVATTNRPIFDENGYIDRDEWGKSRTFPNLGLAKAWLTKTLTELGVAWCGLIEKGSYEDCSFTDPGYGHISDVTWETDYSFEMSAWWEDDGLKIG